MKKVLTALSIILMGLFIMAALYVQSDAFARTLRPFVVGPLEELLGPSAKIGLVKASLLPPSLELHDLSIADARGKPVTTIRKVKAVINPAPLLWKTIRISSLALFEPRFLAEREKDGTWNLTPLLERIRAKADRMQSEGQSRYRLLVQAITIRAGQVELKDPITSVHLSAQDLFVRATVNLSKGKIRTTMSGSSVRVVAPACPLFLGAVKASLEYNRGHYLIHSVKFSTPDARVHVSGRIGPFPTVPLDVKLTVRSGGTSLEGFMNRFRAVDKRRVHRSTASARIQGTLSDPVLEGTLRIPVLPVREYLLQNVAASFTYRDRIFSFQGRKWRLAKSGKTISLDTLEGSLAYHDDVVEIRRFDVRAEELSLHLEGKADPSTGFDAFFSAETSGKGRTSSFFSTIPLEGALSVKGHLSGALSSPRFDGTVAGGPLRVRGIPFAGLSGRVEYDQKRITLSSVNIQEGSSRYILDGSVDLGDKEPVYDARLKVVRSDVVNIVALFYKQLPLKFFAVGELLFNGTGRKYTGSGHLKIDAGSAYGESFTRGIITASLTTGKIAFPQVVVTKDRGMVKATGWIGFDGTHSADLISRDVDLAAIDHLAVLSLSGGSRIDIHSSGSFSRPFVKASLLVDSLSYRKAPLGKARAEAEVKDSLLIATAGLWDERAYLSVRCSFQKPFAWTATARINAEGVDPFILFGNRGPSDRMNLIAKGTVAARGAGMDLSSLFGEAVFQRLSLVIGDYRIDNESAAGITVDAGTLTVNSVNFIGPGTRVTVDGSTKLLSDVDMALTGSADLSLLKLMYREVEQAGGTADMKLTIQNGWKNPDVDGELRIQNGEVKMKDVPQRFTALNGAVLFTQGRIVADSLTGEMGGGRLGASGWVQLAGFALKDFSAKASVENVTVRYPEGLTSTLSGDLYYDGDASSQSLTGDMTIKRARYDKRIDWKSMVSNIGRGLYQRKKTEVGWIGDTLINVRFHGADDILFQNNLAKIALDIDVFLRGTVNHPQLVGRVESRKGTVYFRKNEFKILHASADFIDPGRMNPVLDIQAETRVREYQIQLAVTGTVEHAQVTIISDPPLMDNDILSLLALGKRGSELQGKESGVGVGEAVSFASGQFQDVFERRARSLTGLDRFQVDPYVGRNDTAVPRITVGKELIQNKLYTTYSSNVGASVPEQMFRIEHILNKHFSLVGEVDEMGNTGADIKYRFEFK